MKVLLINGSPHENGCTYTALKEVSKTLEQEDIETEIHWIANKPAYGCTACGGCQKLGKCVYDDQSNIIAQKMKEADGIIIGSPVYYAGINGALSAILDKAFYQDSASYENKIAAAVVSCRRGGAGSAFDRINKYFTICRMPIASGQYWNAVHGNTPDEVKQDIEGMQQMRDLGRSMAWLIKNTYESKTPEREEKTFYNFIR